jgi:hypothetical protein
VFCQSCGEQSGASFCPSCGSPLQAPEPESGHRGVGAGGIVVLLLTALALAPLLLGGTRLPSWQLRLPGWLSITRPHGPEPAATTNLNLPAETAVQRPAEPYEEVSSTRLRLSEYTLREVRVRLSPEKTANEVDGLLRSKVKSLRADADVVLLRLYAPGSDATSSDPWLVSYVAVDPGRTAYGELNGLDEIEPQLYRSPLPR